MNYDSPPAIRAELDRRGLTLKKRWGQNFLINRGARESLIRWLSPQPGQMVWEIGPGLGSMTELLLSQGAVCTAFEIDRGLCRYLEETFGEKAGFSLVPGDFVKTWRDARKAHGSPQLLLGNLPYRSASLIIAEVIEGGLKPQRSIVTVQREAAQRMCSAPRLKSFSSFSVLCQAVFEVRMLGDLKPGSFYPAPDVTSTVVEMVPRSDAPAGASLEMLGALARALFSSRRKTVRNNLAAAGLPGGITPQEALAVLESLGVDPGSRAEELAPKIFVQAAVELSKPRAADLRGSSGP